MILGSAQLMEKSESPPAVLRQNVASRGGTTESALLVFEKGGFTKLVEDVVEAAYQRAKELGNQ